MRYWLQALSRRLAWSTAGVLIAAGSVHAQESYSDLQNRLEATNRILAELKAQVQAKAVPPASLNAGGNVQLDEAAVKRIAAGILAEKEKLQKADAAAAQQKLDDEGYKVGTALGMNARWEPKAGSGLIVETTNKDFILHIGGHVQWDNVAFTESPILKSPAQFGDLQDGTFFRRSRIQFDGTFWEQYEFNMIYSLDRVTEGIPNLSEFYAGMHDIPWLGTVRAGQLRLSQGLEGDTTSSSRAVTFMEASSMTDAFYQRFGTGVFIGNHILGDHVTWAVMGYRENLALHDPNGADFGDGEYAVDGRLTYLPVYKDDGACLVHLGVSGNWRKSEKPDPGLAGPGSVRFRARPELRDAQGDFGSTVNGVTLPGNSSRLVDTGTFAADSTGVIGAEFFAVNGPLSVMSEWAFVTANDATTGSGRTATHQDRSFNGGYVQVGYFLTGEHRVYDRRGGKLSSSYLDGPTTNFWATKGEDGSWLVGRGAVEVAARYSYLNMNDGPIQGGVYSGYTVGLNWFLNPNLRLEVNYVNDTRYDKSASAPGVVQGLGTRLDFGF